MTIGSVWLGLRITRVRLDRNGKWHPNQPCIFFLWRGRRV
jgi:hypothetical protein